MVVNQPTRELTHLPIGKPNKNQAKQKQKRKKKENAQNRRHKYNDESQRPHEIKISPQSNVTYSKHAD